MSIAEVTPDEIDMQMIEEIETDGLGEAVSWTAYKVEREEQGVSLNQYCLYKLAK